MLDNKTQYYVTLKENDIDPYWYEMTRCVEDISPDLWTKGQKVAFLKYLFRYLQKEGISPFKAMCMGVLPECFHEQLSPELVDAFKRHEEKERQEKKKLEQKQEAEYYVVTQRKKHLDTVFVYHKSLFDSLSVEDKDMFLNLHSYNEGWLEAKFIKKMRKQGFRFNTVEEFKDFSFKLAFNVSK